MPTSSTELSELLAFSIYQHDQGYTLAWTVDTAWGIQIEELIDQGGISRATGPSRSIEIADTGEHRGHRHSLWSEYHPKAGTLSFTDWSHWGMAGQVSVLTLQKVAIKQDPS